MTSPRNRSEDISWLVKALAAAQGEIKDIARNRTVKVATRQGGEYSFKYATLSAIIDGIREPLSKNGLAYTQVTEWSDKYECYVLTTTLHWENQWISSYMLVSAGQYQEFGSGMTYMKRYALAALVGVAPDEDDDGNLASGNQVQAMQEGVPPSQRSPEPPAPSPLTPPKPVEGPEASFSPNAIPLLTDEQGGWMEWGKQIMAQARRAPSNAALEALLSNNGVSLNGMFDAAPKLHKNLTVAIQKLNPGAENAKQ